MGKVPRPALRNRQAVGLIKSACNCLAHGATEVCLRLKGADVRLVRRGRWVRVSVSALGDGRMLFRESRGMALDWKVVAEWLAFPDVPPGDVLSVTDIRGTRTGTCKDATELWDLEELMDAAQRLAGLI